MFSFFGSVFTLPFFISYRKGILLTSESGMKCIGLLCSLVDRRPILYEMKMVSCKHQANAIWNERTNAGLLWSMLQGKLIIYWREFLPFFHIMSFPTDVSSKIFENLGYTWPLCRHFLASAYDRAANNNKEAKTMGQPRFHKSVMTSFRAQRLIEYVIS